MLIFEILSLTFIQLNFNNNSYLKWGLTGDHNANINLLSNEKNK